MEKINFLIVKENFEKLSKGDKAELRRVSDLTDIFKKGVSYRLLPKDERPSKQWERVLFFIPFGKHSIDGKRLGELFALLEIKNDKLQQMLKSTYPNDLLLLRDLLKWVDNKGLLKLNYQYLAEALYFWGAGYKSSIEKDYFYTKRLIEKGDVQPIKDLMATLRDPDKEFDGIDVPKVVIDNLPTSYVNESKSVVNDLTPANLDDKEQPSQTAKATIKANTNDDNDESDDESDLSNITSDNKLVAQIDIESTESTESINLSTNNFVEISSSVGRSKTSKNIKSDKAKLGKTSVENKIHNTNEINIKYETDINKSKTITKTKLIKRNKEIKE